MVVPLVFTWKISNFMAGELPGIAFEKVVAAIQAQIDPTSSVVHNEVIEDRLGHARQFDIVIRGSFAGQAMLGIIECKDLKRKVGTPEIDAFVTKGQDVNANFKVVMSRSGFTKPALEKCVHYGVQALSLVENDPANRQFRIGSWWKADVSRWSQIRISLGFVEPPAEPVVFAAEQIKINNKRVFDWFTNYLLDHESEIKDLGWVVGFAATFDTPQMVEIKPGIEYLCRSLSFHAERVCDKLEHFVGISGPGFFNWNLKKATFPPNTPIMMDAVPMDFTKWKPRPEEPRPPSGFLDVHMVAHSVSFPRVEDAIKLDEL
jgi:hypothetical protein